MSVIDDYLANVTPAHKAELERVRRIIKQTAPDAEETISYKMPAFKYKGQPLMYFSSFKDHMSLFPTNQPIETLKDKLSDFQTSKGTIQFTVEKPLPDSLVQELVRTRIAQIDS